MLLDEIKATLAIEQLYLTPDEEQLLRDYAEGRVSFSELYSFVVKTLKKAEAA